MAIGNAFPSRRAVRARRSHGSQASKKSITERIPSFQLQPSSPTRTRPPATTSHARACSPPQCLGPSRRRLGLQPQQARAAAAPLPPLPLQSPSRARSRTGNQARYRAWSQILDISGHRVQHAAVFFAKIANCCVLVIPTPNISICPPN